jgi:NAD(P)-dependent dehydrogenase (short-subunit alcohol dehydrogenase family)
MSDRLAGRVGIVTGASSGIGRATAIAAAAEGATVVAAGRSSERLEETAALAAELAGSVISHPCDLRSDQAIGALFAAAEAVAGQVDFVVNNAGVSNSAQLHDVDGQAWDDVQLINVRAVMLCCKYAVASMLRTGTPGSIINLGSTLSLQGAPSSVVYTMSKHAVLGLTRAAASDPTYASAGIRINCVCPGDILTPMISRHFEEADDPEAAQREMEDWYPAHRLGTPEEIASVIVFLASDEASLINGAAIAADMGLTARGYW